MLLTKKEVWKRRIRREMVKDSGENIRQKKFGKKGLKERKEGEG